MSLQAGGIRGHECTYNNTAKKTVSIRAVHLAYIRGPLLIHCGGRSSLATTVMRQVRNERPSAAPARFVADTNATRHYHCLPHAQHAAPTSRTTRPHALVAALVVFRGDLPFSPARPRTWCLSASEGYSDAASAVNAEWTGNGQIPAPNPLLFTPVRPVLPKDSQGGVRIAQWTTARAAVAARLLS